MKKIVLNGLFLSRNMIDQISLQMIIDKVGGKRSQITIDSQKTK